MATSPLGNFADLSTYRRNLDLQKAQQLASDPLADLILSAQQGYALQQLPQTMMAQRQAQQEAALATQLKNALVAEQLNVLRNPEAARNARLQEDILKGLVSGTNPGLVLEPQTDPALIEARAAAEAAGGTPTTSYAGGDFVPLGTLPGGRRAGISPSAAADATAKKNAARIAEIQARADAAGIPGKVNIDPDGNVQFIPTRMTGGQAPVATQVLGPDGKPTKGQVKAAGSKGGLTPNQQATILSKASNNGLDPDSEKYFDSETGQYDFQALAIDSGKAARENRRLENERKANSLTGKSKNDIENLNATEKQLSNLQDEITEIVKSGKTPTLFDDAIAAATAAPPDGFFGTFYQRILKSGQSEESKEIERKKSVIAATLMKAISGAAVTASEAVRNSWIPKVGDSFDELIKKAALVQDYIKGQREGLQGGSATPAPASTVPAAGTKIGRFTVVQ